MHHQKFNISRQYISEKIFIPEPPQQGELWPNLNITVLPDYLVYIKHQLTKQQKMLVSDYRLQTYLLQTALKAHPKNDFDICTNQIIAHIRSQPQFWVKKIGAEQESQKMHEAIEEYHKDCTFIDSHPLKDKYPQREYKIPEWVKIQDDYVYFGGEVAKGPHRFAASLYSQISNYLTKKQRLSSESQMEFIQQFTVYLAFKAKHRYRQYSSFNSHQSPQNLSLKIQQEIKKFNQYLQSQQIDTRSLSTAKDYYIISNSLYICRAYFTQTNQRQSNLQKEQEQPMELIQPANKFQTNIVQEGLDQIFQDLVNRFIYASELERVVNFLISGGYQKFCLISRARNEKEQKSINAWAGLYNYSEDDLERAFESYCQIVNHPENINKMKYKVEGSEVNWTEEQYIKFLQKYKQFYYLPTNNKKIALAMGKDIQSNHVKHVKGIYTRNMSIRIANGQIGGGKKGTFQSKTEFIAKDIENFNMKWFKKQAKGKTKKIKRKRRRREIFADQQHDSDY